MDSVLSPVSTGPGSVRQVSSAELVWESPRRTRRAKRRMRPVRVMERSVGDLPVLTIQNPSDVQGAVVYDCRPPLLPVSLQLSDIGPLSGLPTVVSASVAVPPWEDGLTISGVGSDGLVVLELGVAPLEGSGTDLEDELPTPDGSPPTDTVKPGEVILPEVGPAPRDVDLDVARVLLEVAVLPVMVTLIIDLLWSRPWRRRCTQCLPFRWCLYPTRSRCRWPLPFGGWVGARFGISPRRAWCRLPSLRTNDVSGPPSRMAPMDQYLPRNASLLLGESTDFPFRPAPLTPRRIIKKMVSGSVAGSPTGESVAAASPSTCMPDLSRITAFIYTIRGCGAISVYKLEGNRGTRMSLDWTHPIGYPLTARTRDQIAPVYTRGLPINFALCVSFFSLLWGVSGIIFCLCICPVLLEISITAESFINWATKPK